MVWHQVPRHVQQIYPKRIWRKASDEGKVYLTFDDGPVPGVTDFVLTELEKRAMKATFFLVGDNVRKHSLLAKEVLEAGHRVGNHTYHHLNGWKTNLEKYLQDIQECDEMLLENLGVQTNLFRPPYGMMTTSQATEVLKTKQVIMWDVLSGDYDPQLSSERILKKTIKYTQEGSIVLFHDQQKTAGILPKCLPAYLDFIHGEGWQTELL